MSAPIVGAGTVQRLRGLGCPGGQVLSVYLDVDPHESSARSAAKLQARLEALLSHATGADAEHVRQLLGSILPPERGTRGLALFSAAGGAAGSAVALPAPAGCMVVVDTVPWLEPIAGIVSCGDWGVALIGRRTARLLRGGPRALIEFVTLGCVDGQAGAPAKDLAEHAERVAALLLRAHQRRAIEHVAVAAPPALRAAFERALPCDLRERLACSLAEDLRQAPAHEISRALHSAIQRAERDAIAQRASATSTGTGPQGSIAGARATSTRLLLRQLTICHPVPQPRVAGAAVGDARHAHVA